MAKKQERYKKVSTVYKKGRGGGKSVRLNRAELAEGAVASELLKKRSTSEFSTAELGALMQVPPGGAEPHQIKTNSRQFNRVANDMPEATVSDILVGPMGDYKKKPMSAKTPKIDLND
jgi:hypothetical protein